MKVITEHLDMGAMGDLQGESGQTVTNSLNGDSLSHMEGTWSNNRKLADCHMAGPRQRKISHRKVIIHDDGEICNKTYNKVSELTVPSCDSAARLGVSLHSRPRP